MRWLMVVVSLVGCGKGPQPASKTPVSPPSPDASAVPVDAAPIADASVAVMPPPPTDPLAGKSPDEQWTWATSLVPELSTYAQRPDAPKFDALGLKAGAITLYAPAIEIGNLVKPLAACTPLPMKLDKESGELRTRISPDGKRIGPSLALKDYVELDVGTSFGDVKYEGGQQLVQADGGIPGYLSEVSKSGLRYDGSSDSMHVLCAKVVTKETCLDGTTQVCEQCNPTVASEHQVSVGAAGLMNPKPHECKPCPPPALAPYQITALDHVLRDHPLMRVEKESGQAFFTRQADCRAALRKKPPKPEE